MNGSSVAQFLTSLHLDIPLPAGFEVMNPYSDPAVRDIVTKFCARYYNSPITRLPVFGINPGRLGGGVTGLSFTDPHAVVHDLHIDTAVEGRREPSATFISMVVAEYGGAQAWYHDVFLSAWSPLGFIRNGLNVNFYDDPHLLSAITPFVLECARSTFGLGVRSDTCVVLGMGKLKDAVEKHFRKPLAIGQVVYLEHPRYIMQYRRRYVDDYVRKYVDTIRALRAS